MIKKVIFFLAGAFTLSPFIAFSQSDIGDLFKSGPQDAQKLVGAYISPLFKGLGTGLNSGWTNTAKAKKPFRFDLRIIGTMAFVPNMDKAYDVNQLGLENIRPADPHKSVGPTIFGEKKDGPLMEIYDRNFPDPDPATFNLPKGIGLNYVPSPQVQLTLGLLKYVDVSLRLVPDIKIEDGKLNMFGAGAKIELLPILLGKKQKITPFDLAVTFGYTKLNYNLPLTLEDQTTHDQVIDVKMDGYSAEALISKKIAFFTPFVSIGLHRSESKLNALGSYDFDIAVTPLTPTGKKTFVNPISLEQTDINGLKATLGFQLHVSFFRIFASYTQAQYSYGNVGIGFGTGK